MIPLSRWCFQPGEHVKVNFNTTNSLQTRAQMVDMLSRDEFVNVINQFGDANQKSLLGTANTDWNDEVYRTAFGTDNNLSVSGSIDKWLPFRVPFASFSTIENSNLTLLRSLLKRL